MSSIDQFLFQDKKRPEPQDNQTMTDVSEHNPEQKGKGYCRK